MKFTAMSERRPCSCVGPLCYGALIVSAVVAMAGAVDGGDASSEQGVQLLSEGNTAFAWDLYKRQAATSAAAQPQNIFMSPLSVSVAMAMTYVGARAQTRAQMRQVMHFNDTEDDQLHQAFSDILAALNQPQQAYKLYMANRLFGERTYSFLETYLAAVRENYGAELAPVDFRGDSSGATEIINGWVAEQTVDKITKLLSPGDVDSLTRLVLVNAVYFKGDWLEKFNSSLTENDDFHVSANEVAKVDLMYMKEKFVHGMNSELNCQAIELPYSGRNLSMFVLLPHQGSSLSELEGQLTAADLVNVEETFSMWRKEVKLWLPRFKLDEKLGLADMLSAMGMPDLFTVDVTDLSGVDGTKDLSVSKVVHQAVVEVNEEGTEAAAATAVIVTFASAPMADINFRADRPFLFFIQHKDTKSILFLGRLVKPSSVTVTSTAARMSTVAVAAAFLAALWPLLVYL